MSRKYSKELMSEAISRCEGFAVKSSFHQCPIHSEVVVRLLSLRRTTQRGISLMKIVCTEMLKLLAKSVRATLPDLFTGQLTVKLHFHQGVMKAAVVGYEEGEKFA